MEQDFNEDEKFKAVMAKVDEQLDSISLEIDTEIDLEKYAYRQDFAFISRTMGEQTLIPVQRPAPQSWVYIPSDPKMRRTIAILEIKQTKENYLVIPEVAIHLDGDVSNRLLVPYQDRDGGLFLWAVRLTDARGNKDPWALSAQRVVTQFCDKWIKIRSMLNASCYQVLLAPIEIPAPVWPEGGLAYLVNRAFRNKTINAVNDPVVQKLKGFL